jgi:hypothetical protein
MYGAIAGSGVEGHNGTDALVGAGALCAHADRDAKIANATATTKNENVRAPLMGGDSLLANAAIASTAPSCRGWVFSQPPESSPDCARCPSRTKRDHARGKSPIQHKFMRFARFDAFQLAARSLR